MNKVLSSLKNLDDLIIKINKLEEIANNKFLFTMNIVIIYLNINTEEGITNHFICFY